MTRFKASFLCKTSASVLGASIRYAIGKPVPSPVPRIANNSNFWRFVLYVESINNSFTLNVSQHFKPKEVLKPSANGRCSRKILCNDLERSTSISTDLRGSSSSLYRLLSRLFHLLHTSEYKIVGRTFFWEWKRISPGKLQIVWGVLAFLCVLQWEMFVPGEARAWIHACNWDE